MYMIGSDLLHSDAELFMYIFRGFFFFGSIFFVNPLKYVLQGGRLDLDFLWTFEDFCGICTVNFGNQ